MSTASAQTTKRYVHGLELQASTPDRVESCEVSLLPATQDRLHAAVLSGSHVHVAWVTWAGGTGTALHAHENEQFIHVLSGALVVDVNGRLHRAPEGHVAHVPAGMPHAVLAEPGTQARFIAVKDTRAGMFDAPAARSSDWKLDGGGALAASSTQLVAPETRFVYRWADLDQVPEGPNSAKVLPRGKVSGKSSSFGAALVGDKVQVGVIHKATGSGSKLHTHPNEQFNLVLQGALQADIDGQEQVRVPLHHAIHMPAGVVHSTMASAAGDVIFFVAKDTRHGLAGPPIDGIEDGPRYLPGFGPRK